MINLNEKFESPFIKKNWSNSEFQKAMKLISQAYDIDLNHLTPETFYLENSVTASKKNQKGLFKFWVWKGKIEVFTHSNSLVANNYHLGTTPAKLNRWGVLLTNMPFTTGKGDTSAQWRNFLATADQCYIIDVEKAMKIKEIKKLRSIGKAGATAMMTNKEIKEMNIKRYQKMMKDMRFTDGSEADLISNINRYLLNASRKMSMENLFSLLFTDSWISRNAMDYSNKLLGFFEELNKNGFLLPNYEDGDAPTSFANYSTSIKVEDMRSTSDRIKNYFEERNDNIFDNGVKQLKDSNSTFNKLLSDNESPTYVKYIDNIQSAVNTAIEYINLISRNGNKIISNKNISENILIFDMFWQQINLVSTNMNSDVTDIVRFIASVGRIEESLKKFGTEAVLFDMSNTAKRYINSTTVKRLEQIMNVLSRL